MITWFNALYKCVLVMWQPFVEADEFANLNRNVYYGLLI